MTRSTHTTLLGLALLAVLLAPAGWAGPAAVDDGNARTTGATAGTLELTSTDAERGATVTVTLAADAAGVAGYQANVTFDPDVVRVKQVSGADFSAPVANVDNDAGWVFLTQSKADGVDDPTLATITFEVIGDPGEATRLSFVGADTRVNDAHGEMLSVSTEAGTVQVAGGSVATQDAGTATAGSDGAGPSDGGPGDAGNQQAAGAATTPQATASNGGGLVAGFGAMQVLACAAVLFVTLGLGVTVGRVAG